MVISKFPLNSFVGLDFSTLICRVETENETQQNHNFKSSPLYSLFKWGKLLPYIPKQKKFITIRTNSVISLKILKLGSSRNFCSVDVCSDSYTSTLKRKFCILNTFSKDFDNKPLNHTYICNTGT